MWKHIHPLSSASSFHFSYGLQVTSFEILESTVLSSPSPQNSMFRPNPASRVCCRVFHSYVPLLLNKMEFDIFPRLLPGSRSLGLRVRHSLLDQGGGERMRFRSAPTNNSKEKPKRCLVPKFPLGVRTSHRLHQADFIREQTHSRITEKH